MVQTVICAKWGSRYPAAYVNCLLAMIRRNTKRDTRLVCYTDDPSGIHPDVATYPMPVVTLPTSKANHPWRKVALWQEKLEGISGDVLFAGSIGRTDLPGGDGSAMQRSLRDVVLPLPDSTLVLPGHGLDTTIGSESGHLDEWVERGW